MMENRFEPNRQDAQSAPRYQPLARTEQLGSLCLGVRSRFPDLLEDDGSVRPDEAIALHGHMAVCQTCKQEYVRMQQVVTSIETLALLDPPVDFAAKVHDEIVSRSLKVLLVAEPGNEQRSQPNATNHSTNRTITVATAEKTALHSSTSSKTRAINLRSTIISLLVVISILAMPWCRTAMGVNFEFARQAMHQLGQFTAEIPVIGWVVNLAAMILINIASGAGAAVAGSSPLLAGYVLDTLLVTAAAWSMRRRIPGYTGI